VSFSLHNTSRSVARFASEETASLKEWLAHAEGELHAVRSHGSALADEAVRAVAAQAKKFGLQLITTLAVCRAGFAARPAMWRSLDQRRPRR
jgi:hypothetical protein